MQVKQVVKRKWFLLGITILCSAIIIGAFTGKLYIFGNKQKGSVIPGAGTLSVPTSTAERIEGERVSTPKDTVLDDDPNGFDDELPGIYKPKGKGFLDKNNPREAKNVSLEPSQSTLPTDAELAVKYASKRKLLSPVPYNGIQSVIPYVKHQLIQEPYKDDFGKEFLTYKISEPIFVEGIKEYPNDFPDEYIVTFQNDGKIVGNAVVVIFDGQLDIASMGPVGEIPLYLTKDELIHKVEEKTNKKVESVVYVLDYIRVSGKIMVNSMNPLVKVTTTDGTVYYLDRMASGNIYTKEEIDHFRSITPKNYFH